MLLLYAGNVFSQDVDDIKKEINQIIRYDTDLDFKNTPGFIVGILDGDSTYYISFGERSRSEKESLRKDDIFEIGSISKVITSSMVALLEQQGKIERNQAINDLLPDSKKNPRLENLTIKDLLNHQSGFPKVPRHMGSSQKVIQDPYQHYNKEDLLDYYTHYVSDKKKRAFSYSHTGYALLEILLETAMSKAYDDLARVHIFEPLEMKNSFITFKEKVEIVQGYNLSLIHI